MLQSVAGLLHYHKTVVHCPAVVLHSVFELGHLGEVVLVLARGALTLFPAVVALPFGEAVFEKSSLASAPAGLASRPAGCHFPKAVLPSRKNPLRFEGSELHLARRLAHFANGKHQQQAANSDSTEPPSLRGQGTIIGTSRQYAR